MTLALVMDEPWSSGQIQIIWGFHTLSVTHNFQYELCHTLSFNTNFHKTTSSHSLSHTTLSRTMFQHKLSRTRTNTSLSHFLSHTPLSRAIFQHKLSHTQLCHTLSYTHNFFHEPYFNTNDPCFVWKVWRFWLWRFAWQAWGLVTSTLHLRGSLGTYGTGLCLVVEPLYWVRFGGALGPVSRPGHRQTLRGMRGTW